jgi:serine protease Do
VVANTPVGKRVEVEVLRQGQTKTFSLTIVELPEASAADAPDVAEQLGMEVQDLTPEVAQRLGLTHTQGIVVTEIDEDGPAAEAGIRRGDVILEVNRQRVADTQQYTEALQSSRDDTTLLLIARGENTLYVALKPMPQ